MQSLSLNFHDIEYTFQLGLWKGNQDALKITAVGPDGETWSRLLIEPIFNDTSRFSTKIIYKMMDDLNRGISPNNCEILFPSGPLRNHNLKLGFKFSEGILAFSIFADAYRGRRRMSDGIEFFECVSADSQ